jgi:hypothetical protein
MVVEKHGRGSPQGSKNKPKPTMVEKRGHGCPLGSTKKPKPTAIDASSSTPARRRRGRPLGSKNKPKGTATTAYVAEHLDVSLGHHDLPEVSCESLFFFLQFLVLTAISNNVFL